MTHDVIALGSDSMPVSGRLVADAVYTVDQTTDEVGTLGASGLIVIINVKSITTSPSVVFTIRGVVRDSAGNKITFDLLASAAVIGVGTTRLQVSPNITAVTNTAANALLPDRFEVFCDHSNTNCIEYSVTAILTP